MHRARIHSMHDSRVLGVEDLGPHSQVDVADEEELQERMGGGNYKKVVMEGLAGVLQCVQILGKTVQHAVIREQMHAASTVQST